MLFPENHLLASRWFSWNIITYFFKIKVRCCKICGLLQSWLALQGLISTRHRAMTPFTLCMLGNFSCFCCCLLNFFQNWHFPKILSETLSECQMVWLQIRTEALSALIWIQTFCKDYQQMTKVATSKEWVKLVLVIHILALLFQTIPWVQAGPWQ